MRNNDAKNAFFAYIHYIINENDTPAARRCAVMPIYSRGKSPEPKRPSWIGEKDEILLRGKPGGVAYEVCCRL